MLPPKFLFWDGAEKDAEKRSRSLLVNLAGKDIDFGLDEKMLFGIKFILSFSPDSVLYQKCL